MVLVDTSVWINHLRNNEPLLAQLLENNQVLVHPSLKILEAKHREAKIFSPQKR